MAKHLRILHDDGLEAEPSRPDGWAPRELRALDHGELDRASGGRNI